MTTYDTLSEFINQAIADLRLPEEPAGLYQPITYTLESGGKRLRPTLMLAVMKALGADPKDGINQAMAIEMFHNFTLLHDDVMDNSDVRRGRPTVHRRWSDNTAILSGDAMLTLAYQLLAKDCPAQVLPRALALFNRTALEVYEGQQYDMDFEDRRDVTVDEYINMIRLKTSVLLACACKMGALIAGAQADVADAFYDYGLKLGLGFQLQDDLLDTFGDSLIFGKHIGGDILNDKKTWLQITAIAEDTTGTMRRALQGDYEGDEKIQHVRDVYTALHLDQRIRSLVNEYADQAILALDGVSLDDTSREYFVSLAHTLTDRQN